MLFDLPVGEPLQLVLVAYTVHQVQPKRVNIRISRVDAQTNLLSHIFFAVSVKPRVCATQELKQNDSRGPPIHAERDGGVLVASPASPEMPNSVCNTLIVSHDLAEPKSHSLSIAHSTLMFSGLTSQCKIFLL